MLVTASIFTNTALFAGAETYNNQFTDVSTSDWFYSDVADAYSLGLMSGKSDSLFSPDGYLTVAEAVKLASSCHQLLKNGKTENIPASGKSWYSGYLDYAKKNNIVTEDYDNYNAYTSRASLAVLFSRAITNSGVTLDELNKAEYGDLSDVPTDAWYAGAVYRLYRWGIMTGDASGKINPAGMVKRSEVSALVTRIAYKDKRVKVGESKPGTTTQPNNPSNETGFDLEQAALYTGEVKQSNFEGITSFAAEFTKNDGEWSKGSSYSLDTVNNIVLENDNISFRLYRKGGFDALGIVRGWLNNSAVGINGGKVKEIADVYADINDLCYIYIDGERITVEQLWYADHDDYVTYALYFTRKVKPSEISSVELFCGKVDSEELTLCGLSSLEEKIANAEKNLTYNKNNSSNGNSGFENGGVTTSKSEIYETALRDAKNNAEVVFEQDTSRCTVLYGAGLNGTGSGDYRLLFIFPDGTVQTIAYGRLSDVRISNGVLYYTTTAPDGMKLQYGVNFGNN